MNWKIFTLFSFCSLLILSCNKDLTADVNELGCTEIIKNAKQYEIGPEGGTAINEVIIDGSCVEINFSYGGGCQDHVINVVAEETYSFSQDIPKIRCKIHHHNTDNCEAWITQTKTFDLLDIKHPDHDKLILELKHIDSTFTINY